MKMDDEALQRSGAEIFLRENRTRETASSTEPSSRRLVAANNELGQLYVTLDAVGSDKIKLILEISMVFRLQ